MKVWNRPDYLRRTLRALAACDGIEDYVLCPHVEPGNDEVRDLIEDVSFCRCVPTWNPVKLGSDFNTAGALADGFARSDYVVLVEDDVTLAPDALRFYEWAEAAYRDDSGVSTVTANNRQYAPVDPADHHRVERRAWFHGITFASWADRYRKIEGRIGEKLGWDVLISGILVGAGLKEVYPVLGRCDHIGLITSIHLNSIYTPEWFLANASSPYWAGNLEVAPGEWAEG